MIILQISKKMDSLLTMLRFILWQLFLLGDLFDIDGMQG